MPREHVGRCLSFEREEDAANFADQVCAPVRRGKGRGKGRGRGGGAPDPTGGQGRGRGGASPFAATHPTAMPMPMQMQNLDMGNHPPIPPVGMPLADSHVCSFSMPTRPNAIPGTGPSSSTHPGPDERAHGPDECAHPGNRHERAHGTGERPYPGSAAMNAPPAMYQHAPAPQSAPTMGEFTVQQWKAASACRECQAKRLTVEAQNNGTAAQRALQAEAELRNANADLIAKAARCALVINGKSTVITKLQLQLKTQQELVIATEKSRVEMQKNASAAAKASTALQNRLEKTEASCIRLMNAAEDREKILAAPAHVEPKVDVEPKAMAKASPKRKLKTDADRFESKAKVSPKRKIKTDVGLFVEAQRAYPLEHGESGAGRQQRGRDIQKYYAGLLRERDKQATKSSKSKKSKFFRSSEFNGARPGFVFKTGSKGVGYYAEVKDGRNAKCSTTTTDSSQQPQTVFGTDSEADEDQAPPTPPNFDEIEVDNGKDAMEDLTSSLQSSAVSQHVDDFVSPCEHQQEETTAKGLQRLDNGHWGRCGKPHPQSAFQTGPSSPSASQSSSSSNSTYLRKKGLCKTTKKPKASKRKVVQPPRCLPAMQQCTCTRS